MMSEAPPAVRLALRRDCSNGEAILLQEAQAAPVHRSNIEKILFSQQIGVFNNCRIIKKIALTMQASQREALAWQNARSDRVCLDFSLVTFFASRQRK
jgi:hypothetical protein